VYVLDLFPQILYKRARSAPASIAFRFFQGGGLPTTLTIRELWERAASLAVLLQSRGLSKQTVVIVCKSQKHFILAFFACLLAGVIAVPTAAPRRRALAGRLDLLADNAGAHAIMTDCDEIAIGASDILSRLPCLDLRAYDDLPYHAQSAEELIHQDLSGDSTAFLQYTSGSTGAPKGVVVTHANLIHNCAVIQESMCITSSSSIFTALPLFHDMGLIGGVLEAMYVGCVANCMPPNEFVQYPERWLAIISKFKVTHSGGPNFMFQLAASGIEDEQLTEYDLSTWQVAFCGAEPIRASTIARFTERFAPIGFRAQAFYPCYGMAESTLFITGGTVGKLASIKDRHGSEIVGCGAPRKDMRVYIVDPTTRERMIDGEVGEVWVRGGSVAQGYFKQADLTEQYFHAVMANAAPTEHYLRTGDLGFLEDGELYITGRLKDLIILYGKKYSAEDIEEASTHAHEAVRPGCSAAISVDQHGNERLVLVVELSREWFGRRAEWEAIGDLLRSHISNALQIALAETVFLRPGALPRTSSGKIQRGQCRSQYSEGAFAPI
jgi:acyl-CoA synthetase (AMP-forming)/AMP-acid ligase II